MQKGAGALRGHDCSWMVILFRVAMRVSISVINFLDGDRSEQPRFLQWRTRMKRIAGSPGHTLLRRKAAITNEAVDPEICHGNL